MNALIVILWTLTGFAVGVTVLGELAPLWGIPNREGAAGMFAIAVGGPLGTIAGVLLSLRLLRRYATDLRRKRYMAAGALAILIGVPLGLWAHETWRTWDRIYPSGDEYGLSFQIRLPAAHPSPEGAKIGIELRSPKENPSCIVYDHPHGLSRESDRFIISARCPLRYRTAKRSILMRMGDEPTQVFEARVAARPESRTYSEWFPADEVFDNVSGQRRPPRPDEKYEIRYAAR